jgi:electron transfer flavoprotein alpha subunit
MSTPAITVVLHPWLSSREEREHILVEATRLGAGADPQVLEFTGETHPAAVARHVAERLRAAHGRQLLLLPTSTESEAIAAQIAVRADGESLGRCRGVAIAGDAVTATRVAFGSRVEIALRSSARVVCATLRPSGSEGSAMTAMTVSEIALDEPAPYAVEAQPAEGGRPRVEGAPVVVSGGRGIGGAEGFEWLSRIAHALGAGLAGSLPTVDAGWVPVAHQVGISGKFVAPKLYFAVAISGTPQHMAGIAPTTRIVALNNDRDAPIFSRCDVAVEGDWREILPLLAQALESGRAGR